MTLVFIMMGISAKSLTFTMVAGCTGITAEGVTKGPGVLTTSSSSSSSYSSSTSLTVTKMLGGLVVVSSSGRTVVVVVGGSVVVVVVVVSGKASVVAMEAMLAVTLPLREDNKESPLARVVLWIEAVVRCSVGVVCCSTGVVVRCLAVVVR